ncbi:P-loop NTPase [Adlercreutzia sp. R7]|uniref:P-loop NTPase n=1 Tax=Adlercreutzia wanghongyangiae TaxID=3111451 RepID=A0ABU6IK19_9ACTN|nr:P-loop NTPase [Adlercreutzia sp. R7]
MSKRREIALCIGAGPAADELVSRWGEEGRQIASRVHVMPSDERARAALAALDEVREVWVAAGEGLGAINLAAAVKADHPGRKVYLVDCEETGSVRSRMHAAALDGTRSLSELTAVVRAQMARGDAAAPGADSADGLPSGAEEPPSVPPLSATQETVPEAAAQALLAERSTEASTGLARAGFLLTVVSGSGGAGKSTVSTLAAHLAARRGLRTALLDADLQFGDLRDLAGSCLRVPLEEVAADGSALAAADDAPLTLIEAPRRLETAEVLGAALPAVVDELLARFDFVAVNTGAGWDEQRLALLERSVSTLFLVDQRTSSVRACRHALDLCLRCGVATSSFLLAVNRCTRHAPFTSIDVSSALHGAHVVELADGGREVEELLGAGMVEALVESRNPLCTSIDRLLDEILPGAGGMASCGGEPLSPGRRGLRGTPRRESGRRRGRREEKERRRSRKEARAASGVLS